MTHFIHDYWLYLVSLVILVLNGRYWVEARHAARMARIERESCERMQKQIGGWMDEWIDDRRRAFEARQDLDRRLLADLDARFGTDMAKKFEKGKPS